MYIAIVVGEPSGDLLAANLMRSLKKIEPDIFFYGVGGQEMVKEGFNAWYRMEDYAFMGLHQLPYRYLQLKILQKTIISKLCNQKPDVFIGVDSSGFNISLSRQLKQHGIKTIQYVSPQVWAWRPRRVYKIKHAVEMVLTLLPFESEFLQRFDISTRYVGHPFVEEVAVKQNKNLLRIKYACTVQEKILVVMPGSRLSDLKYMSPLFIKTMLILQSRMPELKFFVPLSSDKLKRKFDYYLKKMGGNLNVTVVVGASREVISIADVVLLKSGAASFETMLLKKPMVVAYKMGWLTFCYVKINIKIPYISMPNILAGEKIVEEFTQTKAKPAVLAENCLSLLKSKTKCNRLMRIFHQLHMNLKKQCTTSAADEIIKVCNF